MKHLVAMLALLLVLGSPFAITCPSNSTPVCGLNGVTYNNSSLCLANGTYISYCGTCVNSYAASYNACASNVSIYGTTNRSYFERYLSCSFATLVGGSFQYGQGLLAVLFCGFFVTFVMFQNTRIEGKMVVLIPVAFMMAIWVGWIMMLLGGFVGIILYLALRRFF